MTSQTDLDQGGTSRSWEQVYLGPSVGWVRRPVTSTLVITAGGTYTLDLSTSFVTVNTTGAVTITLPSAVVSGSGAQAQPGTFVKNPIVIVDVGGNATAHPITIQPVSGSETIMGLASITLSVNFGGYTLAPNSTQATWNSISP